jgi:hypothetical protein
MAYSCGRCLSLRLTENLPTSCFINAVARGGGVELPDILALDYLPTQAKPTWALPTWRKEWAAAMDKQLAHLSYERDKAWVHHQWVPILEKEFRQAWTKFRRLVSVKYKKAFTAEIAKCRKKHGFRAIKL